jgi:hypothetical protein
MKPKLWPASGRELTQHRPEAGQVQVRFFGGRIVRATDQGILERTEGVRLQVSFGDETMRIYLWQIISSHA